MKAIEAEKRRGKARRGYTLIELAISMLVLVAAMGVTVKALGWLGQERRAGDRRQWAVQAASNVMERLASEPYEQVSDATAKALVAEAGADRVLPGAVWDVTVTDDAGSPVPGKRVALALRWRERSGGWGSPVRLTSWVYRRRNPS
jgi:prepilin-type N-terminal cleavage/methylation domain-containing protein